MRTLQFFGNHTERVTSVEVIGIDYSERLLDSFFSHEHCVVCAPGFGAVGRTCVAFGKLVECLKNDFGGYDTFVFTEYFFAEIFFEILADDEYDFSESGFDCVVDGIIHDCLAVWAETVELFETAVTAAHAGGKNE